jgi:hypothetical protein
MQDIIIVGIILVIIGFSIAKIVSEKKKGVKCIGCPYAHANKNGASGCNCSK